MRIDEQMRIDELIKDTFYILPFELTYENNPFDTIYIGKDGMMLVDSEHFVIDGMSLKELYNSKKGKR